jgi:predicted nucleotide-binding protein
MGSPLGSITKNKSKILVVEDDQYFLSMVCEMLTDINCIPVACSTPQDSLDFSSKEHFDLFLVDAMLPNYPEMSGIGDLEARGGFQTGVALLRKLQDRFKGTPAILFTGGPNADIRRWCHESGVEYMLKPISRNDLREAVERLIGKKIKHRSPTSFIVHGRDNAAVRALTTLLKDNLGFEEPIVLREQAGKGKTLIESLESFEYNVDVVFVLLTPDDKVCLVEDEEDVKRCARQNVIFELGLFYGFLGRKSGRVILLHRGPIDLPSDIQGIKFVDIGQSKENIERALRKELSEWL